eukprot:11760750-Karenia_brevis.AAC.1
MKLVPPAPAHNGHTLAIGGSPPVGWCSWMRRRNRAMITFWITPGLPGVPGMGLFGECGLPDTFP